MTGEDARDAAPEREHAPDATPDESDAQHTAGSQADPMDTGDPMADTGDGQDHTGVPDTDPRHIDPAGEFAAAVEHGEFDLALQQIDDADRVALEDFLDRAEAGEFGTTPGVEAVVRIVRALLDEHGDE